MKRIYLALFGLLVMCIIAGLLFFFEDELNESHIKSKQEEFNLEKWQGVVTRKYIDNSNHNAETFELSSGKSYAMFRDETDFYEFINFGDSLVKKSNTDTILVYRQNNEYWFRIIWE